METTTINIKKLAELMLPAFAISNKVTILSTDERTIFYRKDDKVSAWIPTDIISLIKLYLELNKSNYEDIDLIIDTKEYYNNPKKWINEFSQKISEEINKNNKKIDFEDEYINIEYQLDELNKLKELDERVRTQLTDMCTWIIAEKNRRKALNNYNPSPVNIKDYKNKGSEKMNIEEELLKRYQYLNENKELILANFIIDRTETKYIKKELKRIKSIAKSVKKDKELKELTKQLIEEYKNDLKETKPYLSSKSSERNLDVLEELILGDKPLETTRLYNYIEKIKQDEDLLSMFESKITKLEVRRNKNDHLKRIPTFTVWKILSYIRKKYENNITVQKALDKYYNLERYTIAKDDCDYGYYIPEGAKTEKEYPDSSIYVSANGDGIISKYFGNEFEEEDKYKEIDGGIKMNENYYPTKFANELANLDMIQNKEGKLNDEIITVKEIITIREYKKRRKELKKILY